MEPRPDTRPPPGGPSASDVLAGGFRSAGPLLFVVGPILLVLAATAVLAIVAWSVDWYRVEMLIAGEFAGLAAGTLATFLLYRQYRQRNAAKLALRNAAERIDDIVESAMDPIITIDASRRVVLFNKAAETVFGFPREAVVGQPIEMLIPPRFHARHRADVERFGGQGTTSRRMGGAAVLTGLRASGEEFPIEASISQHSEDGRQLLTVILRDVSERVRFEAALRRSQQELRELGAAANDAREQEKSRIARELHDELAQSLTALQMDIAWCSERVPEGEDATRARFTRMAALLDQTVAATRRIASDLRPLMLDDLGLVPAVEWLTETFAERNRIPCELFANDAELELPKPHATAVFRIIQESLANIGKHARASRVRVSIERNGAEVRLGVRDDGAGFSPQDPRKPSSFGLLGLRERTSLLGGEVTITSAPGQGTHVEVRIPLAGSTATP